MVDFFATRVECDSCSAPEIYCVLLSVLFFKMTRKGQAQEYEVNTIVNMAIQILEVCSEQL